MRQRGRSDQVAEHDGELSSLAPGLRPGPSLRGSGQRLAAARAEAVCGRAFAAPQRAQTSESLAPQAGQNAALAGASR
jgi:hypothetical protein